MKNYDALYQLRKRPTHLLDRGAVLWNLCKNLCKENDEEVCQFSFGAVIADYG